MFGLSCTFPMINTADSVTGPYGVWYPRMAVSDARGCQVCLIPVQFLLSNLSLQRILTENNLQGSTKIHVI